MLKWEVVSRQNNDLSDIFDGGQCPNGAREVILVPNCFRNDEVLGPSILNEWSTLDDILHGGLKKDIFGKGFVKKGKT